MRAQRAAPQPPAAGALTPSIPVDVGSSAGSDVGHYRFGAGAAAMGSADGPVATLPTAGGFLNDMDELEVGFLSDLLLPEDVRATPRTRKPSEPSADEGDDSDAHSSSSRSQDASGSSNSGDETPKSSDAADKIPRRRPVSRRKLEERRARRRAQVAVSARRHRSRKKSELMELRASESELSERLASLRANLNAIRPSRAVAAAEEVAVAERLKRQRVEDINAELRRALVMQRRFFGTLKSVLLTSAEANSEVDMKMLLHTYTHLGQNPWSRARDFKSICSDSKVDLAMQILLRETEGYDFSKPAIVTRSVQTTSPTETAVTATATYAFEAMDLKSTFVSACGAILGYNSDWPRFTTVTRRNQIADAPSGHIRYGVSELQYQSEDGGGTLTVGSRPLTHYRMTDTYGVLVWDFADLDDLFPLDQTTAVKRDVIGAMLLRREICADGVERVVYRSLCTKIHTFPSVPALSPVLAEYADYCHQGAKMCGASIYNQVHSDIARSLVEL